MEKIRSYLFDIFRISYISTKDFMITFILFFIFASYLYYLSNNLVYSLTDSLGYKLFIKDNSGQGLQSIDKGSYVVFRVVDNKYIGTKDLIKQVSCVEGDILFVKGSDYFCNGIYLGRAKDFALDGRKLDSFKVDGGKMLIPQGFYFLSGKSIHSFDSRYYGLLKRSDILYIVRPVF